MKKAGNLNMYHRTKPTGYIKYTTTYNGRKIYFGFDRDFVYINCVSYEDGSDVPCEDVIRCLFEIHQTNPSVAMVDGTGQYQYDHESRTLKEDGNGPVHGNSIVFDREGRPIVKVIDDVVYSAYVKCACDNNYPSAAFIVTGSMDEARAQIITSGCFTPLKKKYPPFGRYYCSCKTCGARYSLSRWAFPKWKRITPYEWPDDGTCGTDA